VSRDGKEEPIEASPETYSHPRISPDERLIALTNETSGNSDVWIWDLFRKTMMRLTFDDGEDSYPVWSPDGNRIAFHSSHMGVAWKAADGTGEVKTLGVDRNPNIYPTSWSRDGKTLLLYEVTTGSGGADIVSLTTEGECVKRPLLTGNYHEYNPQLSPDGKWMAYTSQESGRDEIYVRPFPEVDKGGRWQISREGGFQSIWSWDGRELFYRSGNSMMAVSIEREPSFSAGLSKKLFQGMYLTGVGQMYDVTRDGKRFLMIKESGSTATGAKSTQQINIVLNWFEELKQRVPVK
jgi:serine/threonine-protein kinase